MKIIYWRASLLILSWVLLGVVINLINMRVTHIEPATFGNLVIATAAYLIATTALIKPITHK